METNSKSIAKGFEGKNFYLDLENSPQICRQLTQLITQLGGTIKSFLNEKVKYIITCRPKDQWPPKVANTGKSRQLSALNHINDQTIQSPINLNKNSDIFSRGKLLLSKHQQMVSKPKPILPTDVLELARFWNITIMRAIDVLEFCKTHLSPVIPDNPVVNSVEIKRLKGSFIKVEDNRLQHRPIYREFYDWPQIYYESHEYLCPFVKKKLINETPIEEPVESLEGLAVKNKFEDKLSNNTTINTNNDNNNNNKTKPKTSPKNKKLVKKRLIKKRRIPAFCEICCIEYEDLSEHLKSEVHENYTINEDNYKELKGVISSLHPFTDSTTTAKRIQFDGGSDSEGESDSDQLCSPFQSTPNLLTTIQLCGSKHKSHFLPIHDMIGNKSPQEDDCNYIESETESSVTDLVFIPPSITSPPSKSGQQITGLCRESSEQLNYKTEEVLNESEPINISEEL